MSAIGGKADMERSVRISDFDPKRTLLFKTAMAIDADCAI
jgi:hypothetical protein